MNTVSSQKLEIAVGHATSVSALLILPPQARACFVFAHGAGAGMTHPFMEAVATGLAERGVATLRYQFPYMEKASKRPDPPGIAQAAVRAAVAEAGRHWVNLRLISRRDRVGGAMTSQGRAPLAGVRGLAFLGFPLHPAGKPSSDRAKHLADVRIPMLFMQGTRDNHAEVSLLEPVVKSLGPSASLHRVEGADHSFHVPARSGRKDIEVMDEILDAFANWIEAIEAKREDT